MDCVRWRWGFSLFALAMLLFVPTLAWAAAEHGGEKPGILSPRFDLGIWTIVVFGVLYLVLRYVTLPGASAPAFVMMLEGLRKREENIQRAIAEAQQTRAEAQRLREELQKQMDRAQQQVAALMDEARKDAERSAREIVAEARAEIQQERERLHREIEAAKDQALHEIWNHTARLATEVSAKAIGRQITIDDQRRLIEEALAEFSSRGKEHQRQLAGVRA
jgi:F-type H+-transporting ATPase subunit b